MKTHVRTAIIGVSAAVALSVPSVALAQGSGHGQVPQAGAAFREAQTGGQGPLLARPAQIPVRPLPSWLTWTYQRGTHHQCVTVWNNTPNGDTSVRLCKSGLVETS